MRHTLSLPTLLLLAAAAPAGAQELIRVDQTVTGQLTRSDATDEEDVYYDLYRFHGRANERYTITLLSGYFDAYLRVGPGLPQCAGDCREDDDGFYGMDAQLRYQPDRDGQFLIQVTSYGPGLGEYSLRVQLADGPWSTDTAVATPQVHQGRLVPGETFSGRLTPELPRHEDGAWYQEWEYQAHPGESIVLNMESSGFDTMLMLGRPIDGAWRELARDDDGGTGTNSELRYSFDKGGIYTVRATSYHPATGDYTLRLQSQNTVVVPVVDTASAPMTLLEAGRDVAGQLSNEDLNVDGRYQDLYRYWGRAGESVTLTLQSADFDAYLVVAAQGIGELASDDDGGAGTDARITVTLPATGEYTVRATSFDSNETGAYTLRLDRR